MRHHRDSPAERLIDLHLPRRVGEMIVAANDMGDAHVVIVDDDGEHIGRRAVGAQQNKIVEILVGPGDPPLHFIVENGFALLRGLEPDDRFYARRRFARRAGRASARHSAAGGPSARAFARISLSSSGVA